MQCDRLGSTKLALQEVREQFEIQQPVADKDISGSVEVHPVC
jgi:hypothetical protein